jgi:hypothetical protein
MFLDLFEQSHSLDDCQCTAGNVDILTADQTRGVFLEYGDLMTEFGEMVAQGGTGNSSTTNQDLHGGSVSDSDKGEVDSLPDYFLCGLYPSTYLTRRTALGEHVNLTRTSFGSSKVIWLCVAPKPFIARKSGAEVSTILTIGRVRCSILDTYTSYTSLSESLWLHKAARTCESLQSGAANMVQTQSMTTIGGAPGLTFPQ